MLIDSGATYFFVSVSHAKFLNHKIESLGRGILVSIPSREVFMVKSVCRDCEIRIENVTMRVDLILFKLDELDVNLMMEFPH